MGVCAIATAWFPLLSITALPSVNYNEGWNAYRQWMTVEHQPLYGSVPALWTTNYPFLSFHIIGWLGAAWGHMVLAGRIVCFASLAVVSVLVGGIVRGVTGSRAGGVYAGLYLFAGIGAFNGVGRAVNDPELLGVAFATFGLFAYLRAPWARFWCAIAAVAFCLSLFTKHDLLAFPLSVGIHLLITRNVRGLAVFVATGVVASCLLLALSFHIDGPYFFAALLQPRAYSLPNLCSGTLHYLLHFLAPMLVGLVLLWRNPSAPCRSFLFTLLVAANIVSLGFAGGDGVAANIFYPALMADVLACTIAICWLAREGGQFQTALVITTVAGALMVPFQIHTDIAAWKRLPAATKTAQQTIAFLKSTNGPAICEDLLLCYEAGKPMDYDPYYVKDQILIGRVPESTIQALLMAHHYTAIQINDKSLALRKGGRFTASFLQVFLRQYRPVFAGQTYIIFVPRT